MLTYDSLDEKDWKLLNLLRRDARAPFAQLGRQVRLTAPAVAERVRRMEDAGIITGYEARVSRAKIGFPLAVFLEIQVSPKDYPRFTKAVLALDEVEECHHVTGNRAFILKASLRGVPELDDLIRKLTTYGPTITSLVLSRTK